MKKAATLLLLALLAHAHGAGAATRNTLTAAEKSAGWQLLFDGRSLDGWKAAEAPATFSVKDGCIVAHGARAHLFYAGAVQAHDFKNFELQFDVMTFPKANSGMYFHTVWQDTGWPTKGYEIQVNNSHTDPKRTAGVYGIKDNFAEVAKDNEWFTMRIKVEGKHIVTTVNDRVISDYTEEEKPERPKNFADRLVSHGTFAIQGHDPGSQVQYRNIKVRPLP
jgi:Domain of Unknown Function (DUF1080)